MELFKDKESLKSKKIILQFVNSLFMILLVLKEQDELFDVGNNSLKKNSNDLNNIELNFDLKGRSESKNSILSFLILIILTLPWKEIKQNVSPLFKDKTLNNSREFPIVRQLFDLNTSEIGFFKYKKMYV